MKKVKVLILDDSLFIREAMQQELERDTNIRVVGKAGNAYDARDMIVEYMPDVLIADVNLGRMSGMEFVRMLLPQYYLPVIMISSDPSQRAEALAIQAVDFISKPTNGDGKEVSAFYRNVGAAIKNIVNNDKMRFPIDSLSDICISIGASTGGAEALIQILKDMPAVLPPIVIAQHMPPNFTRSFAERVNQQSALSIKEAEDGDVLIPGQAYIAPGGVDTVVKKMKGRYCIGLMESFSAKKATPNIDTLFQSVARAYGADSVGILLTGMGKDGAQGLLAMHDLGSRTIVQDKESSVVYGMPRAAFELGAADYQLPLKDIRTKCIDLVRKIVEAKES